MEGPSWTQLCVLPHDAWRPPQPRAEGLNPQKADCFQSGETQGGLILVRVGTVATPLLSRGRRRRGPRSRRGACSPET